MFEVGEGRFDGLGVVPVDSVALRAALDAFSGLDLGGIDTDVLPSVVVSLVHAVRVMQAAAASAMVVLSDAGASERTGGLLVGNWWEFRRLGHGASGAWMLRAGELMGEFPALGAAVRAGELGLDHLRVLDEIRDPVLRTELVGRDAELLGIAKACSSLQWRRGPPPDRRDPQGPHRAGDRHRRTLRRALRGRRSSASRTRPER